MTATSGHMIRLLTVAEITKHAAVLGWDTCTRQRCEDPHVYVVSLIDGLGKRTRRRVCARHGRRFAERHKLDLPAAVLEPKPGGAQTARSRSGLTFAVCGRCRHWTGRTTTATGQCIEGCLCTDPCHAGEIAAVLAEMGEAT